MEHPWAQFWVIIIELRLDLGTRGLKLPKFDLLGQCYPTLTVIGSTSHLIQSKYSYLKNNPTFYIENNTTSWHLF